MTCHFQIVVTKEKKKLLTLTSLAQDHRSLVRRRAGTVPFCPPAVCLALHSSSFSLGLCFHFHCHLWSPNLTEVSWRHQIQIGARWPWSLHHWFPFLWPQSIIEFDLYLVSLQCFVFILCYIITHVRQAGQEFIILTLEIETWREAQRGEGSCPRASVYECK